MDMYHVTQKLIVLLRLSLKGITRDGGGQGIAPQSSWLEQVYASCWELLEGLHGDLHKVIAGAGKN